MGFSGRSKRPVFHGMLILGVETRT